MSVCFVVVPVVSAVAMGGLPMISAAIVAAGAAMGYQALGRGQGVSSGIDAALPVRSVQMQMSESDALSDTLMRGELFSMERDGIAATFHIDGRGACKVHLDGAGYSEAQLEAAGHELMDAVRQQFAYAKVMKEMEERGFQVVHQEVEESRSIRIRVRRT